MNETKGGQTGRRRQRAPALVSLALASSAYAGGCSVDGRSVAAESLMGTDARGGSGGNLAGAGGDATPPIDAPPAPPGGDAGIDPGPPPPPAGSGDAGPASGAGCSGVSADTLDASCQCVPGASEACDVADTARVCARATRTCELSANGLLSQFGACVVSDADDGTTCDDGDARTLLDSCLGGSCSGTPLGLLATGSTASCAVRGGGVVYCWGGAAITGANEAPPTQVALPVPAVSVSVGNDHACAVGVDSGLYCWGNNGLGALGNGSTDPVAGPVTVALGGVVQVTTSTTNTLALTSSGSVFAWGANIPGLSQPELYGPLPPASESQFVTSPLQVAELGQVTWLGLGARHACAVLGSGQFVCWGSNASAQLGRPALSATDAQGSTQLVDLGGADDSTSAAAGESYSCALRRGGAVVCWGSIFSSDLDPAEALNAPPREVPGLSGAVQISVGSSSACALRGDRSVACWGANVFGELGTGSFVGSLVAQPVSGLTDAVSLGAASALAGRSMCALRSSGDVVCWGENNLGQLGDGTTATRALPAPVLGLPD